MAEKVELTDRRLANLKPAPEGTRYELADTHVGGLRVRVGDAEDDRGKAASVTWVLLARFPPSTNPTRRALGAYPAMSLADARLAAIGWKDMIRAGKDPAAEAERERQEKAEAERQAAGRTFKAVADLFLERYVAKVGLRTAPEIEANLKRHVRGDWDDRLVDSITRRDVVQLLDKVEDAAGPVAADKVLAHLSKLFAWHQARDDTFTSPIVRGMGRAKPKDRARARILSDDELRAVWWAAEGQGTFGALVQLLLLTAQRRAKVAALQWSHVAKDGNWRLPVEAREKGNAGELVLPAEALAIIKRQPRWAKVPYVLAGRTGGAVAGFSKMKPRLDVEAAKLLGRPVPGWTLHDLRRTAKSLMTRAGVQPHVSERVLGHAIVGVEGVYDRHSYAAEKAEALARLAALVRAIVGDKPPLAATKARRSTAPRKASSTSTPSTLTTPSA